MLDKSWTRYREKAEKIPLVTPNDASFGEYSFASIMLRLPAKMNINKEP